EVVDAVDLDLVARVLAEQDAIALLHAERANLALVVDLAVADRDHLALGGLLLGRVGDDDAALRLFLFGDAAHENAILQRADFHWSSSVGIDDPSPAKRERGWVRIVFGTRFRRLPAREFTR